MSCDSIVYLRHLSNDSEVANMMHKETCVRLIVDNSSSYSDYRSVSISLQTMKILLITEESTFVDQYYRL